MAELQVNRSRSLSCGKRDKWPFNDCSLLKVK